MPNYKYPGVNRGYSEEEIKGLANKEGISFEEYLQKYGFTVDTSPPSWESNAAKLKAGREAVSSSGNLNDSTGDPTTGQKNTGSDLEDGSSESPNYLDERQPFAIGNFETSNRTKIINAVEDNKLGFFAEENTAPKLREIIEGSGWDVSEQGGINHITLERGDIKQTFSLQESAYETERLGLPPVSERIADFILNPPEKSPEYKKDKKSFMLFMDDYYNSTEEIENPNYVEGGTEPKKIKVKSKDKSKIKELTSKEFLANVENENDFKRKIKVDLGYGKNFWNADNRTMFPNLTDQDVDNLIGDKFRLEKNKEDQVVRDQRDVDFLDGLKSGEFVNPQTGEKLKTEQDFFTSYYENQIATTGDEDLATLATANMKLLHGNLGVKEKEEQEEIKRLALLALKKKGEFEVGFDLETGLLVRQPKVWSEDEEDPNFQSAEDDVKNEMANITQSFGNQPKGSHLDIIENDYFRNAKQITELQAMLNKETDISYSHLVSPKGAASGYATTRKQFEKSMSNKDIIKLLHDSPIKSTMQLDDLKPSDGSMSKGEYSDYLDRTKAQLKKLQVKQEALKRMYLYNESAMSIEKKTPTVGDALMGIGTLGTEEYKEGEGWTGSGFGSGLLDKKLGLFGQQSGKMALNSVFGEGAWESVTGKPATETEVIDEYVNAFNDAGIPVSAELQNYSERSFGQQVTEGVSGSTGILLEFAVANKATAALRAAKLFKGGKTFNDLIQGAKATRYTNKSGLVLTEAQIAAKVAKAKKYKTVQSWANRYAGKGKSFTAIGPNKVKWLGASLTEGVIEGVKFGVLPSSSGDRAGSFATGFGFGLAGQFLTPVLGTINKSKLEKITPRNKIGNWVVNQAPRLDKAYNLAFKAPLSFAVGSELGEISLAMANDAFGLDEVSTFMHHHYGDYSEATQRFLVNTAVGSTFGLTHKATYSIPKTLNGLKAAKAEAEGKIYEKLDNNTFKVLTKKGKILTLTREQYNKTKYDKDLGYKLYKKPGQFVVKESIMKLPLAERIVELNKHKDVIDAMNYEIRKSEDALDLYDPVLAPFRLEKMYKDQNKHYEEKGAKIEVVRGDNNSKYFKDNPNAKAKTEYIDGKGKVHADFKEGVTKKVRQTFNVDKIEPGIAPHELGHSGTSILFGTNARFKADFLTKMMNIAGEVPMESGAGGAKRTLRNALIEQNGTWDTNRNAWENARINEWEVFSHLAEQLAKPENLRALQASKAFEKFDKLIEKEIGGELNQKYDFRTHRDVVRFFADYIKTVNKGSNSLGALKHLDGVIYKGTEKEAKELQEGFEKEGIVFDKGLQSRDLSLEKSKLFNRNIELGKTKPEGYRAEMDANVKKIGELNRNIKASEVNAEQIAKYKEAIKEEAGIKDKPKDFINPKKERAFKALKENNIGILNEFVNKNYKDIPGSNLTKAELKTYVENNEFLKILNSYNVESGVPFGAYLKQNLRPRMGNILKALGVDLGTKMKTVSIDSPEAMQLEAGKQGSFSNEAAGGKKGIELIYELPVKQETIDGIVGKVSTLDIRNIDYRTLKDMFPDATKEMFGKTNKEKAQFIADNWKTIRDLLPQNTSGITGKATGIENSILKDFYKKGKRVKMAETGDKAGNPIQEKILMNKGTFLDKLGIKVGKDGVVDISNMNRNIKTSTIPAIINQTGKAITNQIVGKEVLNSGRENAATMFNQITSGKSKALQSKKLEIQAFADQVNFLFEVQGKTFEKMFKRNMASIEDPVKAINKTLTEYFTDYKKRGNEFNISNTDLRTIGKELHKEYKFTKLTPTRIASKAAKAIVMPNDLKSIDIKAGLEPTPFSLNTLSDIVEARAVTRVVAKALVEKYGDGVYEAMLLRGESGGKGVGAFSSLADVIAGTGKGQNRFSLHEASEAAIDFMSDIINSKGKKYSGPTSTMVEGQGNKAGQMRRLIDKTTSEWNKKALNEAYEAGEFNKKVLKDAVQALRKAYKNGDITHTQARQWVEIHGGPMSGLIKLAGSFAVVPNMSPKQMFDLYPETAPKRNAEGKIERYDKDVLYKTGKNKGKIQHKKGDAIYESNYVLEHTTPAQYVKARVYDYIINGGEAKKSAMDLTLKDYHTTLIPKQFDVMVNKTLQTNLPSWHLPGMDPISSRYYEASHPSNFGFGLRNFKTGKVYDYHPNLTVKQKQKLGKQLGEINSKLFPKGLRKAAGKELNSKQLELADSIDKALIEGRKKNKKSRGMSTWDFDDTLATTKSGVRARMPNMDGLPKPSRKVIFLAGGAGSGKGNVIKKLNLEKQGFKLVNSDISLEWLKKNNGLPENMNDLTSAQRSKLGSLQYQARSIAKRKMMKYKGNADGVVVDGTGGSIKSMEALVKEFKDKGYDVSMLFVETSLPTALARNKARAERSLLDKIVERNHESVQGNKSGFKTMFGERFMEVKTDNLKQADAMPKELVDRMNDFVSGYEKIRLDAEQFATEGQSILNRGGKFDFAEFNVVTGGEKGPFFQKALDRAKKFGLKDQFVLTARPPEAARPIYEFLKAQGLEIPLKNITGLGNSTGEAKALWMLKKFSEGYNDMYFADDAIQNVKAVKDVLSQLDIKSKVQQALQSKNLNIDVNKIMEHSLDIGSKKVFSKAEAKVRGKDIKRRRVFMRDSAADLELLIEPLYGKGKEGIKNKEWFKQELVMPFERGIRDYNTARQSAKNDYMGLRKQNKDVVKEISKPVEGTAFTNDMAMRVYLWNKAGYKVPDLAKTTEAKLVQHVANNPRLQAYAESFARITKQEKGLKEPGENWWGETMAGEVTNINRGVSRKQYLQEWIDVKNEIFTEANLNKMESKLGTEWRENITDMFDRMETGRTRSLKMDRGSTAMMNYLNGGIGTIMNFNTRSAVLQTISTTNFLNMRENNPIAAARAMGNVKQFAKDFKYIMNSDMLKQRRDGLAMNVTEAEIASAAASSKNPVQSIISKVLKAGYLPTKMADSFAISFGGATFYRNRVKMYEKQGMKTKEAESKAFLDFQVIAERTQQSSRADLLSKQQTSLIGRFILPFANTPMQMNRAGMKDILDISKGRFKGGGELTEKVGRISYYMGAQVAVFAGLQSALFAMLLNDDDVPEEKIANTKSMMLNTTADSMLRGFGIQGAVMSAFKNATQEYFKQSAKPGFTADYSEVGEDLLNISPPIGSKFGMLDRAGDRKKWAKIRKNDEFKFELGNPSLEASLMSIQAITNAPVYSPYQNIFNMQHALSDQYETWQRVLMGAGWTPYSVGIETEKKKEKKKKKTKKKKLTREQLLYYKR